MLSRVLSLFPLVISAMSTKMPSPLLMQHSPFLNNELFLSPSPTVLSLPSLPKLLPYNMELRDLQLEDAPGSKSVLSFFWL